MNASAPDLSARPVELLWSRFVGDIGKTDRFLYDAKPMPGWSNEPLTERVLADHVFGLRRIGVGQIGSTLYGAIDLDGKKKQADGSYKLDEARAEEAWANARRLEALFERHGIKALVEVSRSGGGWHVWILCDPVDPPTVDEMRRLLKAALHALGLPDDGEEGKGHPGIFPHPPGPRECGRAPFLPWSGLLNGKSGALFVDVADGVPLDRQETALEDADLVTRERVLAVLATLEAAPSKAPAGGSVVPVSSGSTLDRPTDAARHVALWNYAVRWVRMGLGGAEVRTFVEHLAERWGLFAEGRGGEVENIVRGAMLKAKPSGFEGGGASVELRELDLKACLAEVSEPIPWALRVWLARRDAVTLGAEPKVGKSWLALALTVSGAAGRPWLGVVPIEGEPLRVVYVDEEQSPALVRYRIRRLAHGLGLSADDMAALPIRYLCGSGLNLDRPGDRDALFRAVEAHRADLVVFDALVRFHRREENSAGAMAALYDEAVKPLSRQFGAASLVLHHLTKPHKEQSPELVHRLRGSGDLVAAVDQLWTAERGDGGRVALRHERSRWTETAPPLVVAIEDTADGLGVTVTASTVANAAEEAILGVLRDAGTAGALRSDLVAAVEAAGFKAADRITTKHLGRLTAEKRIAKAVERRAVRYWLADMAPRRLVDDEGTD